MAGPELAPGAPAEQLRQPLWGGVGRGEPLAQPHIPETMRITSIIDSIVLRATDWWRERERAAKARQCDRIIADWDKLDRELERRRRRCAAPAN